MSTIEIDFEVFKALTLRRTSEQVTYNDVLRELLNLAPKTGSPPEIRGATRGQEDWLVKGVRFPAGTEFRASYNGRMYLAHVESGALVLDGKQFDSPSAAAGQITGNSVNGWIFWECRLPGESQWVLMKSMRARTNG